MITVYRLNALDQTGARIHFIITVSSTGIMQSTIYTHPAPTESPGGVEDFCNLCNDALKALNPS